AEGAGRPRPGSGSVRAGLGLRLSGEPSRTGSAITPRQPYNLPAASQPPRSKTVTTASAITSRRNGRLWRCLCLMHANTTGNHGISTAGHSLRTAIRSLVLPPHETPRHARPGATRSLAPLALTSRGRYPLFLIGTGGPHSVTATGRTPS